MSSSEEGNSCNILRRQPRAGCDQGRSSRPKRPHKGTIIPETIWTVLSRLELITELIPLGLMHVSAELPREVEELAGARYSHLLCQYDQGRTLRDHSCAVAPAGRLGLDLNVRGKKCVVARAVAGSPCRPGVLERTACARSPGLLPGWPPAPGVMVTGEAWRCTSWPHPSCCRPRHQSL